MRRQKESPQQLATVGAQSVHTRPWELTREERNAKKAPRQLPEVLTSKCNWLLWRLVQNSDDKKPRKVPFYVDGSPRQGAQGTSEDRGRLANYELAREALLVGKYDGLGYAVMPGDGIVALDFDNCVTDGEIEPRIAALVADTYAEFSPSGRGIRAFMLGDLRSHKDNAAAASRNADGTRKDGLFDVEFFGTNGFVTITSQVTPTCATFGLQDTVAPVTPAVLALYRERFGHTNGAVVLAGGAADDADLADLQSDALGWTLEQAREILFACPADTSRAQWVNALMALHHELGDTPEALDLADEWSATATGNYSGRADVEGRWRSFGRAGGQHLTGRWLLAWRNEVQKHLKYDAASEWKAKLQQATDEFQVREKLCPDIARDDRLDDFARETLAQMLRETFTRLGNKYQIAQCRKLLLKPEGKKREADHDRPHWLKDWYWVTDTDMFFRHDSDEWCTAQSFNAQFDRFQPRDDRGMIVQPANLAATRDHDVPVVTRGVYVPWASPQFELNGVKVVNTYRPSSVPTAAQSLDADGKRAVEIVMEHLRLIAGGREDVVRTLLDWLAHQVQKPGVKVRWAPLIKGIEGDGKTTLGVLLSQVMGGANVRNVTAKVLESGFTDYAAGSAVVLLEELKITGHNRHDIINSLKPLIANDSIEVHPKGAKSRESINTTNYLAFTNFADAAPITDTDRRWMIVFTPWTTVEGLVAAVAPLALAAYFNRLFDVVAQQVADLRRWLLDHTISAAFEPNGRAPATAEKSVMVEMSVNEDEANARDLLEKGGAGITADVFLSRRLKQAWINSDLGEMPRTRSWSSFLQRMGYSRQPGKIWWMGQSDNVWVRGHRQLEPEAVRAILDATVTDEQLEGGNDDLF